MLGRFKDRGPEFYGSATVGERGQIAIPAEARRKLDIKPNAKMLVFSGPGKNALMFVKADSVSEMIAEASARISQLEQVLKEGSAERPKRARKKSS